MRGPFSPRPDGSVDVRMADVEARAVRRVAADLADAVAHGEDPSMVRLFPPAYPDDDRRQQDFASLTRDDLVAGKIEAARAVTASIDAGTIRRGRWTGVLDEETAQCWLRVLNDARLILGTRLDVTEETEPMARDDPRAEVMNLYLYLGGLEELLVETLLERFPPGTPEDGSD